LPRSSSCVCQERRLSTSSATTRIRTPCTKPRRSG
jgi:hypothetical protein